MDSFEKLCTVMATMMADNFKAESEDDPAFGQSSSQKSSLRVWDSDFGELSLYGNETRVFSDLVTMVSSYEDIGKKRSVKRIEKGLQRILVDFLAGRLTNTEQLGRRVNELLKELLAPLAPRRVFLPIAGLKVEGSSINVSGIRISENTEKLLHEIRDGYYKIFDSHGLSETYAQEYKSNLWEQIQRTFKNVSVAEFQVEADGENSIELSQAEVEDKLDYLAAFMPAIQGLNRPVWFEVGPPPGSDEYTVFSLNIDHANSRTIGRRPIVSSTITPSRHGRMNQLGFETLSGITKSSSSEKIALRIKRMAKWLGRSMRLQGINEKFLMAANALEAAFTDRDKDRPIAFSLAEAVAFLYCKDLDGRKKVFKQVKELYGIRCGLAHGRSEDATVKQLHELQAYVFDCLCLLLINYDVIKSKTIEGWIEEQRFKSVYDLKWPPPILDI